VLPGHCRRGLLQQDTRSQLGHLRRGPWSVDSRAAQASTLSSRFLIGPSAPARAAAELIALAAGDPHGALASAPTASGASAGEPAASASTRRRAIDSATERREDRHDASAQAPSRWASPAKSKAGRTFRTGLCRPVPTSRDHPKATQQPQSCCSWRLRARSTGTQRAAPGQGGRRRCAVEGSTRAGVCRVPATQAPAGRPWLRQWNPGPTGRSEAAQPAARRSVGPKLRAQVRAASASKTIGSIQ
jgi:hypothetical protein